MKIIFMGTPEFAVPSLEELILRGHEVIGVVTQPDKPKGRGKKLTAPPVKEVAAKYNLVTYQPEKVNNEDFITILKRLSPDCIVVVAYGQILPKKVLEIPALGCINVHASLLPKYRGAAPINWTIINGEKISGVTTMYMDEGLDTGDIILKKEIPIEDKTAGELHDEMSVAGAKLLAETLELIEKKMAPREKQKDEESSYAPLMHKGLGKINWSCRAVDIYNLVRGVNPWPTAYTTYKGIKLKIWKTRVLQNSCTKVPGTILYVRKEGIYVCTGEGILILEEIQFPGRRRMAVAEYLKGNQIEENQVLGE